VRNSDRRTFIGDILSSADFRLPDEAEDYIAFTLEISELKREKATDELEKGSDLPLLVEESSVNRCLFGLSDLIFAFLHEYRITEGEFNVESALTISQLSGTLSCFAVSSLNLKMNLNRQDHSALS